MKNQQIKLTGLNKKEIREQIHNLEEKGMYFGKCIAKSEQDGIITMIFRVDNQFMDTKAYNKLVEVEHDSRIRTGARVRVKSTGEEFTLGKLYEYSRSHKVVYCTSDGRKWTPTTVYKRCEFVCIDEDYNRKFNITY